MQDSYHFCKHKIVTKTCVTQNMLRFPILLRPWRPLAPNSITDAPTFFRSPTCVSLSKNNGFCVFERSAKGLLLLFVGFFFIVFLPRAPSAVHLVQRFPMFQRWHVFVLFVFVTVCLRFFCSFFGVLFRKSLPFTRKTTLSGF